MIYFISVSVTLISTCKRIFSLTKTYFYFWVMIIIILVIIASLCIASWFIVGEDDIDCHGIDSL